MQTAQTVVISAAKSLIYALAGAIILLFVADAVDEIVVNNFSTYYAATYPWAIKYSTTDSDVPRKLGWGNLLFTFTTWGFITVGVTMFVAHIYSSSLRVHLGAFACVILSGLIGVLLGCILGYLTAVLVPDAFRSGYSTGQEPWFEPTHVGIGAGALLGFQICVVLGSIVTLVRTWHRSRIGAKTTSG